MLKHPRESRYQYIFFQGWTWGPLCYPSVLHGTLIKALLMVFCLSDCRWLWQKAGGCGAKCDAETQASSLGTFCACTETTGFSFWKNLSLHWSGAPCCPASLAVCEGEEGLGWWVGFILSVYPLQRKVVARCLDVSLCQRDSRNGDEAIGVSVPDVRYTHSWHGAVNLEKESPDDELTYAGISSKNQIWTCI